HTSNLCMHDYSSLLHCLRSHVTHMCTTTINTLSLHDALPIYTGGVPRMGRPERSGTPAVPVLHLPVSARQFRAHPRQHAVPLGRSEEHTSELQSRENLVCRLLLEKKKLSRLTRLFNTSNKKII